MFRNTIASIMSSTPHLMPVAFGSRAAAPSLATGRRARQLDALRLTLAKLARQESYPGSVCVPLAPEMQTHLPTPGLAGGVLHEIAGDAHEDRPAAFGFVLALMALAGQRHPGPVFLVACRRALSQFGRPYGHGLGALGIDVRRLVLVTARSDKDGLWALEEILRSDARPAVVAGAIDAGLDLTASRRLNLAAARSGAPLLVLGAPLRTGASAAATRWRVASAPAARDRFRTLVYYRWRLVLERCRNGRPGEWLIEWDHAAYRFRLAESMADRTPAAVLRRTA
jgi:protein ImuA